MNIQVLKNYTHQGLCRAIDIFNYPTEFRKSTRILGFRFLLQYRHMDTVLAPSKQRIIDQMKIMIDEHYTANTEESNSVLMELVDMLIDYSPPDGQKLLAYLREKRAVANDKGPDASVNAPECTVYNDTQSVHNKTISESTRRIAKYIAENFRPNYEPSKKYQFYEDVKNNMIQRYGPKVEKVIDRIYVDNAHFNIGYTVDEVFMSMLEWIKYKRKEKGSVFPVKEVFNRLGQELDEMENYCSSGLLTHIVNTIQGFTDGDENLEIRISERDQVKSVVYNYLNKSIQECGDEKVIECMGEPFIRFVKNKVNAKMNDWRCEYGETFLQHLTKVVNEYTSVMTYD